MQAVKLRISRLWCRGSRVRGRRRRLRSFSGQLATTAWCCCGHVLLCFVLPPMVCLQGRRRESVNMVVDGCCFGLQPGTGRGCLRRRYCTYLQSCSACHVAVPQRVSILDTNSCQGSYSAACKLDLHSNVCLPATGTLQYQMTLVYQHMTRRVADIPMGTRCTTYIT